MNIAIVGYGVEGKASYRYFSRAGHDVTIVDERVSLQDVPEGADVISGERALDSLNGFDMVIRTPALRPDRIVTDGVVWSATNEFFAKCPAPIIGVTGTKGKGTTCSLIAAILRAAGKTVHLVGNIGVPALDALPEITADDIVVYELSSFQLWDLQRSPQTAVVLLIEPDHLNVHFNFDEYVEAKSHITLYQSENDTLIYHPSNHASQAIANRSPVRRRLRYLTSDAAHIEGDMIVIDNQSICAVVDVGLRGAYNLENVCAAISASWQYTKDTQAIASAVREFKGLEHRLEYVDTINGIVYYNDSFSSVPIATLAAISAFDDPEVLIVGGFDKGVDVEPFVDAICAASQLKHVVLIGQVRYKLLELFAAREFDAVSVCNAQDMHGVMQCVADYAESGDVVILSPGFASFDMFKNFYERGELFKQAVHSINA